MMELLVVLVPFVLAAIHRPWSGAHTLVVPGCWVPTEPAGKVWSDRPAEPNRSIRSL